MTTPKLTLWLGVLTLASCLAAIAQDRPEPERLRGEARELMSKARDLKANGNFDESEKLARKAKEMVRQAEDMQQKGNRDKIIVEEERIESRSGDPKRSVDQTERRVEKRLIERRRESLDGPDPRARAMGPGSPMVRGRLAVMEARQHHIKKAIKHLRLAGLNAQADRLEDQLRDVTRRFRDRREEVLRERGPGQRPERQDGEDRRNRSDRPERPSS
jgi:hypothetical protein